MSAILRPIASPRIDGTPVRFFKAPFSVPHIPWNAVEDLYRVLRLPRAPSKELLETGRACHGDDFKTVATADGPVVIGSHPMAAGLIGAGIAAGAVPSQIDTAYSMAAGEAMRVLTGGLPLHAQIEMALAATRNTMGSDV